MASTASRREDRATGTCERRGGGHGRRKWSELSNRQRWLIIGGGAVQVTLQAVALRDLRHRPVDDVRGPKGLWALATFINFFGPVAYLVLGRRHRQRT